MQINYTSRNGSEKEERSFRTWTPASQNVQQSDSNRIEVEKTHMQVNGTDQKVQKSPHGKCVHSIL